MVRFSPFCRVGSPADLPGPGRRRGGPRRNSAAAGPAGGWAAAGVISRAPLRRLLVATLRSVREGRVRAPVEERERSPRAREKGRVRSDTPSKERDSVSQPWRIELLGGLRLGKEGRWLPLEPRKPAVLLAALACAAAQPLSR